MRPPCTWPSCEVTLGPGQLWRQGWGAVWEELSRTSVTGGEAGLLLAAQAPRDSETPHLAHPPPRPPLTCSPGAPHLRSELSLALQSRPGG